MRAAAHSASNRPDPRPLLNREFSWIEFNRRVLAEARDSSVPLLERVKFLSITASNLDEFLMVRVGAIHDLIASGINERTADGLTQKQQLKGIRSRVSSLMRAMYECLDGVLPELRGAGIAIERRWSELSKKEQSALNEYFDSSVSPILTPLAIDPGHPFPFLASGALNLAAVFVREGLSSHVVLVQIPRQLPRFVRVGDGGHRFVPIELIVEANVSRFFTGLTLRSVLPFRILRSADLDLPEDEIEDLLKSVESELRRRDRKTVVWMEIEDGEATVVDLLAEALHIRSHDVFLTQSMLRLSDLMEVTRVSGHAVLRDPPFNPRLPAQLATSEDIFSIVRKGDVLLHRPYDSFSAVVEFVQTAAADPDVLAIKMTLYRTDSGSPIIEALMQAAQRGKQVTAVVELQARFDEMKNITWARRLEEQGVQVVYGLIGIKTHCKVCLLVRREGHALRRYVHLSTGNYNASTARLYTDIDLFTTDEAFAEDASQLLNVVTGYSSATAYEIFDRDAGPWRWQRFVVAPTDYHHWVLAMIGREIEHARAGCHAQIIAKMNALVDTAVIHALYDASSAGVKIELIVRGICCLVPGVPGVSDHIRVVSVVDRFLEHSRVFLFRNGGATEVYVGSGDWMPRNFRRRIEAAFPIVNEAIRARVEEQILGTSLADDVKAWKLQSDGTYRRRNPGQPRVRSQERFIENARTEAVGVGSYEEAIAKPGAVRKKAKRRKKK